MLPRTFCVFSFVRLLFCWFPLFLTCLKEVFFSFCFLPKARAQPFNWSVEWIAWCIYSSHTHTIMRSWFNAFCIALFYTLDCLCLIADRAFALSDCTIWSEMHLFLLKRIHKVVSGEQFFFLVFNCNLYKRCIRFFRGKSANSLAHHAYVSLRVSTVLWLVTDLVSHNFHSPIKHIMDTEKRSFIVLALLITIFPQLSRWFLWKGFTLDGNEIVWHISCHFSILAANTSSTSAILLHISIFEIVENDYNSLISCSI